MNVTQSDFDRLRLIRSDNVGPVTYLALRRRFATPADAIAAMPDLAARGGGRAPKIASRISVEKEIARVHKAGAAFVFLGDADYPAILAEIPNPPPALIWRGDLSLFTRPAAAMVGARNASAAACRFARELAGGLTDEGHAVVSGLARGIDTAAHVGSLDGGTIAVIAGGIDVVYPPENRVLQGRIAEQGLLLSEQPPGTEPRARHFPYRNRIIAGLGAGTVVVEAAPRSGSLITARLAGEFGREVMAVPGFPLDPRSRGCNGLIRDGATLIESAADVVEAMGSIAGLAEPRTPASRSFDGAPATPEPMAPPVEPEPTERKDVAALLSMTPVAMDELVRQSGHPAAAVQTVLLELELAGRLTRHAGARVSLSG